MDNREARSLLTQHLEAWRKRSYQELVGLLGNQGCDEVIDWNDLRYGVRSGSSALDRGARWVAPRGAGWSRLSAPLRSRFGARRSRFGFNRVADGLHIDATIDPDVDVSFFRLTTRREKGGLTNIGLQAQ